MEIELMSKSRLTRTIERIAYQILEMSHGSNIVLIGLNQRGYCIASQIQSIIEKSEGKSSCSLLQYRIDEEPEAVPGMPETYQGNNLATFLVDDVIFSGKTMFKAIKNLHNLEEKSAVYTAVLIDRGHRKVPVHASVSGIKVPTKLNEHVKLEFEGMEPEKAILITN